MANTKVSAKTEDTSPALTDLAYSVKNPGTTPVSRKVTWTNIRNLFLGTGSAAGDFSVYSGTAWTKRTLAETKVVLHPSELIGGRVP